MTPRLYLCYSDLFDRKPTIAELKDHLEGIPLRHAAYVLSRLNLALRYAMQEKGRADFAKVQEILIAAHTDDETLGLLKQRFGKAKCDDRPIFLPHCVLSIWRLVIVHGNPIPLPQTEEDEAVRYRIGRACLMMNDLLVSDDEAKALLTGTEDDRRIELMVQTMAGFELTNSPKADHLMPRLQIMYRILLRDPAVKSRIALKCQGLDLEAKFHRLIEIPLERWLFVMFSIYAYFLNGGDALNPNPSYMLINPATFCGESGITATEFNIVLGTILSPIEDLKMTILGENSTDPRYDFVSLRSRPLLKAEDGKLIPVDLAFIIEKCHTGVQWTIHDLLPVKQRHRVFTAWGLLFEEYIHWLLGGMQTTLPIKYIPSPKWKNSAEESFDGILLRGDVIMAAEYKGGS